MFSTSALNWFEGPTALHRRRNDDCSEFQPYPPVANACGPQAGWDDAVPMSLRGFIERDATPPDVGATLWEASDRNALAAAALVSVEMSSEDDLVATAAAAVIHTATGGSSARALDRLSRSLGSADELTRLLALTATATELRDPETMPSPPAPERRDETSVCIHGTWAGIAANPWYASGSPLHHHIQSGCTPNIFDGPDHFRWSGGYAERERIDGARDFPRWKTWQGVGSIDTMFAHSHGGNVALWRLEHGERIRQLVLLHTPITRRKRRQWEEIATRVDSVVVLHTWGDLVMWTDKLRNRSTTRPPRTLPHRHYPLSPTRRASWFSHDYFLRTDTWIEHDVGGLLSYEHRLRRSSSP